MGWKQFAVFSGGLLGWLEARGLEGRDEGPEVVLRW